MIPLFIFGFTLAVLPLVSTRIATILFILAYLTTFFSKTKPARRALTFSILATIALIVASLTAQNLPMPLVLLQWLIIIWSAPLFSMLIGQYGRKKIVTVVLIVISFHAAWGISQFILQRDLGLSAVGESKINIYEPAVAKIDLSYSPFKLLRAYGPYKHANSFAGVLVLGVALLGYITSPGVYPPKWREGEIGPALPAGSRRPGKVLIFFLLTLALATTFSRAAIFSFLLILIFNYKIIFKQKYFLLLAVIVLTFMPLMVWRFSFTGAKDKAVPERINSVQWASEIIKENNFWQGTGIGRYPSALKNYLDSHSITYQPWQTDFVHSVPMLLVAEWGIASIVLLAAFSLWLIAYSLRRHPLLTTTYSLQPLLILLPILLTDHYFVTQLSPAFFLLLTLSLLKEV